VDKIIDSIFPDNTRISNNQIGCQILQGFKSFIEMESFFPNSPVDFEPAREKRENYNIIVGGC
jgi:hypothetical protein